LLGVTAPLVTADIVHPLEVRSATFLALLLAAIGFPLWATAAGPAARRSVVVLAVASASVAAFHLVAAGRSPPFVLAVPPLLVLLEAWALHRKGSWS
jgi:hypothetical protein